MTGEETYGDANHRIKYNADGTYVYYDKDGDDWKLSEDVDNEYNVDGDWLASRWRPKAEEDSVAIVNLSFGVCFYPN